MISKRYMHKARLRKQASDLGRKMAKSRWDADRARRLERERDHWREKYENLSATGIHSCGSHCQRPLCVARRERDEARAEAEKRQSLVNQLAAVVDRLLVPYDCCGNFGGEEWGRSEDHVYEARRVLKVVRAHTRGLTNPRTTE